MLVDASINRSIPICRRRPLFLLSFARLACLPFSFLALFALALLDRTLRWVRAINFGNDPVNVFDRINFAHADTFAQSSLERGAAGSKRPWDSARALRRRGRECETVTVRVGATRR